MGPKKEKKGKDDYPLSDRLLGSKLARDCSIGFPAIKRAAVSPYKTAAQRIALPRGAPRPRKQLGIAIFTFSGSPTISLGATKSPCL